MRKQSDALTKEEFEEILETYIGRVRLPSRKFPVKFMLCPVGLVGAGKSTVVGKLAEKLPMVVVSTDNFRKTLKERGSGYDSAEELTLRAVRHFAKKSWNVAIDSNCGRAEKKKQIEKLARELGAKIVFIEVNPPEAYILNKLKNFEHSWLFKNGEAAVKSYFEYKTLVEKEPVAIDFLYPVTLPWGIKLRGKLAEFVSFILHLTKRPGHSSNGVYSFDPSRFDFPNQISEASVQIRNYLLQS